MSAKGRLPAAAAATGRGHACSCAARSTAAAVAAVRARGCFVVWLVWICKVWFSSCPGSESLPLRLQQSEFRGGQSPHHFSPIFHRHPRHLGGVFLWLFYPRLVRSTRLVKSNKMQENMAKNGWERTKVARIGRSPSLYGQKRVEGGVGQSREPKLSVCCHHTPAHPFLAKNRPGAPVFGHCPF